MTEHLPVESKDIPSEIAEVEASVNGMPDIYHGASMLKLSKREIELLSEPVDEKSVNIRPDGLLYLPQVFVREILNRTFGQCAWAWIHLGDEVKGNTLCVMGALYVRGQFVAKGVGEATYHKDNPMQSWASVWESGKSDSIVRCCKDLGIGKEMWQPRFCEKWIKDNAIKVKVNTKKGLKIWWRRKNAQPFEGEIGVAEKGEASSQPEQATDKSTTTTQPTDPQTTSRAKIAASIEAKDDAEWLEKFAQSVALQEGTEYGDIVQDLSKFSGNKGVRSVEKLSSHPKWLARIVRDNRQNPEKAPEKKRADSEGEGRGEQSEDSKNWWAYLKLLPQDKIDKLTNSDPFMQLPVKKRMDILKEAVGDIAQAIKKAESMSG